MEGYMNSDSQYLSFKTKFQNKIYNRVNVNINN